MTDQKMLLAPAQSQDLFPSFMGDIHPFWGIASGDFTSSIGNHHV
jgi:hypothetical protein